MKPLYLFLLIVLSTLSGFAQDGPKKYSIKGTIKDAVTSETLLGATVIVKAGVGAVADLDGNYDIKVEPGVYTLKVSFVNYAPQSIKVKVVDKDVTVDILMENQQLDEVEITANIGTVRETPVAISNISQQKIQEELGGQDLPMLLNSTPGVYATQQGGGAGDSRITLRGFDQTNVAVMVDGVPVNDMENGTVYWSNWDGLNEITKTMQVQRGLGATKLAISSAGGTMNIITNGIDQKRQTSIKRDYGNNNYQRTSVSYTSGLIKNKFGVTLAGSYRTGDGWVEGTFINAWSYFGKFQWKINSRHLLSISANSAPQSHGQRLTKLPISVYSQSYAAGLGVSDVNKNLLSGGVANVKLGQRPWEYNPDMAMMNGKPFYDNVNFYNKPLFNASHFWSVTDRLTISTVGYASLGKGGGTSLQNAQPFNLNTGYRDLTVWYTQNTTPPSPTSTDYKYYGPENRSKNILRSANNDHQWYGLLSTAILKLDSAFTLTFGVDARYYRGLHYRTVYDLMGGDYYRDNTSNKLAARGVYDPFHPTKVDPNYSNEKKHEGDKIGYNFNSFVNWGGLFSQLEYKKNKWTAFATATGSFTGYQRMDYFDRKDVDFGPKKKGFERMVDYFKSNRNDDVLPAIIGFNETLLAVDSKHYIVYNSTTQTTFDHGDTTFVVTYNTNTTVPKDTAYLVGAKKYTIDSKETHYSRTKKKWFPGFTLKGGVNYKIDAHYNVYANTGILSIAPKFNNVYNGNAVGNKEFKDAQNQVIISEEVGAGAKYRLFAANINLYYTIWNNKPVPTKVLLDGSTVNVNGVNALHKGIEVDFNYNVTKTLNLEGAISLADWTYTSGRTAYVANDNGVITDTVDFSAKGVHIGNAAQNQFSAAARWTIFKGFYIKPRYTYFGKNFANFDAVSLIGANKDRESWRMPDYELVDFNAGYEMKYQGVKLNITASINNFMNVMYISDAQNNAFTLQTFDANAAGVFIGQGRRYVLGLRVTF